MNRLALNPDEIEKRRAERLRRVSLREIPLLRLVGFAFLSFGVFLNNRYLLGIDSYLPWLQTTVMLAVYSAVSWALTVSLYHRTPLDVTLVFLALGLLLGVARTAGRSTFHSGARF